MAAAFVRGSTGPPSLSRSTRLARPVEYATRSAREKLVGSLGEKLQPLGVAPRDFEDAPASVGDVVERFHRRWPIVVAFAEFHLEAFVGAFLIAQFPAVFLDVEIADARAE